MPVAGDIKLVCRLDRLCRLLKLVERQLLSSVCDVCFKLWIWKCVRNF